MSDALSAHARDKARPKHSLVRRLFGPREIFILPTRHGWVFLGALAAMLFGAANYANNLAFLLTFLLFSLAVASLFHTHRNLRGLDLRLAAAPPVFAGRDAVFELVAEAPGLARASLELALESPGDAVLSAAVAGTAAAVDLAPGIARRVGVRAGTIRRGWLIPGPLRVSSTYPLGLFRGWMQRKLPLRCLVYPEPLAVEPVFARGQAGDGQGEAPCPGVDDFTGLRAYQPGDTMQRIAWKASSRGQGLATKEFEGQCGEALLLDFDRLGAGDTEWRLSALTRMVLTADSRQLEYGLKLPGKELEPGRGEEHMKRCLEALALF